MSKCEIESCTYAHSAAVRQQYTIIDTLKYHNIVTMIVAKPIARRVALERTNTVGGIGPRVDVWRNVKCINLDGDDLTWLRKRTKLNGHQICYNGLMHKQNNGKMSPSNSHAKQDNENLRAFRWARNLASAPPSQKGVWAARVAHTTIAHKS